MSVGSTPIDERVVVAASADLSTVNEDSLPPEDLESDLEEQRLSFELKALKQKAIESEDTHNLRLNYAGKLFWLVCGWLICVGITVGLTGFKVCGFVLPEAVLIAFITTTTINVIGLFFVFAKWLYPTKGNSTTE